MTRHYGGLVRITPVDPRRVTRHMANMNPEACKNKRPDTSNIKDSGGYAKKKNEISPSFYCAEKVTDKKRLVIHVTSQHFECQLSGVYDERPLNEVIIPPRSPPRQPTPLQPASVRACALKISHPVGPRDPHPPQCPSS